MKPQKRTESRSHASDLRPTKGRSFAILFKQQTLSLWSAEQSTSSSVWALFRHYSNYAVWKASFCTEWNLVKVRSGRAVWAVERVVMTYLETEAMNHPYREAEAVLIAD